jgi:hypothetical protein
MEQSRFAKYKRTKIKRHARSKLSDGAFEDRNRWYRCWNCGFEYDSTKVIGNQEHAGTYESIPCYPAETPRMSGDILNTVINSWSNLDIGNLSLLDASSSPVKITRTVKAEVSSGCPFCGCGNLP